MECGSLASCTTSGVDFPSGLLSWCILMHAASALHWVVFSPSLEIIWLSAGLQFRSLQLGPTWSTKVGVSTPWSSYILNASAFLWSVPSQPESLGSVSETSDMSLDWSSVSLLSMRLRYDSLAVWPPLSPSAWPCGRRLLCCLGALSPLKPINILLLKWYL